MGEAAMNNELPVDSAGFNDADQFPDELPADFSGFDDETPEELPADFVGFDEDRSSGPPTASATPPSMPQSATAPAATLDSSRLLEPFPLEERGEVMAFMQTLGATAAHVVPRGTPDPFFPRTAPRSWEAWERERNDRMFARARETAREARGNKTIYEVEREIAQEGKREEKRRKDSLHLQRKIGAGWAKWQYWWEQSPAEAQAYRKHYEDTEAEWLLHMAASPKFKRRPKVKTAARPKDSQPRPSPRARGMGS
jgi:hypothetical protein